ncbi:MAG: cupin [Desulfovibrionaceae bacterium]|jgi:quercetin dioxygenase-like cupin family protein|nr:cupin [Desulfovibrionaceae bacterium]
MKRIDLIEQGAFKDSDFASLLVHESPYMKVLNFNFEPGQTLPLHSHDIEGEVAIGVLEGSGAFLSADGEVPATPGSVLVADIADPHGIRADTRMRVLVTIAPPI